MFLSHNRILTGVLGLIASVRLGRAFLRLLFDAGPSGAVDLKLLVVLRARFDEETLLWFSEGMFTGMFTGFPD